MLRHLSIGSGYDEVDWIGEQGRYKHGHKEK